LAYSRRLWLAIEITVDSAVILEVLQLIVPGRHGRASDALVKVAGGITGIMFSVLITRWLSRKQVA
jgi:VanZ family protein